MAGDILIGIDAGTSVIKSVAFSLSGQQIAVASLPNSYTSLSDNGVEQDMARTWSDAAASLRLLADKVPDLSRRTVALGVTGQGDGTWLINKMGEPVGPAWLWLDSRAAAIAEECVSHPDYSQHYARTGTGVNACQQSMHLVWMKRHSPEMLAKAETAFHCKDWLYFNLTGKRVTDPSEANFTYGRFIDRRYQPDILDALLDTREAKDLKRLLPPIHDGTREAASLSVEAAKATGLPHGLPVCLGFVDVICSGLGGGLYDTNGQSGCTIVGSTGMHMRLCQTHDVKLNDEKSGYTMCFPHAEYVAQVQSNMASTLNIDWLLDFALGILKDQGVHRSRADLLKGLDERIMAEPAGRLLYHPYISKAGERGPILEPAARASFIGLEQGMGFNAILRGVFEGLCHAAHDCYDSLGGAPDEVRITGGAARSEVLRTFLASALNARVRTVSREETGAAGAAMIAGVQQRVFTSMDEAAASWVDPALGPLTEPDPTLARVFNQIYPLYRETRTQLRPVWRDMRNIRAHA
jgi:erythritol kinase (D-erythritol 1-phosphate-forming)